MVYISLVPGARQIIFEPIDFLIEAIEEFLESGANTRKIGSCIVKIATAVELLLKDKLEQICPALVLDKIDDAGLQIVKLYGLGKKMVAPKELENVELRTASFPKLLNRVGKFFDITKAQPHLSALHSIRNELVHFRGRVDLIKINLLLIEEIFPFLEQFTAGDPRHKIRLNSDMWERLRQLAESSSDTATTELAKKIGYFSSIAKRLSAKRLKNLFVKMPEAEEGENIGAEELTCPACKNRTLTAFSGWDVDYDETGNITAGWPYAAMRCKVCGLDLDQSEVERIIENFDRFFGVGQEEEKQQWEQSIVEPEPDYS